MLDLLRSEIDACDSQVTDALLRRLAAAVRIAAYKQEHNLAFYHPRREAAVMDRIGQLLQETPYAEPIRELYRTVFRLSRRAQLQHVVPHNIVLIGFMGSGKSTVGRALAELSGYDYYDVDRVIEADTGHAVARLFETGGEGYFRELERQAVARLCGASAAIIACGGGCVLDKRNVACLKQQGKLVWLTAEPETLYDRIRGNGERPLLVNKTKQDIAAMLALRQPLYHSAADYVVPTDDKPVGEIVETILNTLIWDSRPPAATAAVLPDCRQ